MAVAPDRTRTVPFDADRRQAILAALAELPVGPTWDVAIVHNADRPTLEWGSLIDCTCDSVTVEARRRR